MIIGMAPKSVQSDLVHSEGNRDRSNLNSGIFNMLDCPDKQEHGLLNEACNQSESEVTKTW